MKKQKKAAEAETPQRADLRRYSIQDAANLTGISRSSIRRACVNGELNYMRVSGACNSPILIPAAELAAWLRRCELNQRVLSPSEVRAMRQEVAEDE